MYVFIVPPTTSFEFKLFLFPFLLLHFSLGYKFYSSSYDTYVAPKNSESILSAHEMSIKDCMAPHSAKLLVP